ncbi:MAG TPA: ABC transporter ATP-binding protein [Anaerolineaceae bacterium]
MPEPLPNPIIEIQNLRFQYPDGKVALEELTLTIFTGEKVALVGPNGAGKSTLILHLNGIFQGKGSIRVKGVDITSKTLEKVRSMVGLVFQNPDDQLFSPTVYEDVAYGPVYMGLPKAEVHARVTAALNAVHMQGFEQNVPFHLSGGEKKRVAIATVLSMQPEILVFDEPTAGLDPRSRREFIELLEELPQTMLIATHDLDLVQRMTNRVVVIDRGKIVADGSPEQILGDHALLLAHGLA